VKTKGKLRLREYSVSMILGRAPTSNVLFDLIAERAAIAKACNAHFMGAELFGTKPLRRYRRGKNRCRYCGLRTDVPSREDV